MPGIVRRVGRRISGRGLDVSHEIIRCWFLKFRSVIATALRHTRLTPSDYWHLDEMAVIVQEQCYWLWRTMYNEGEVPDFLAQGRRNATAAGKSMKNLLQKQGFTPSRIVTIE